VCADYSFNPSQPASLYYLHIRTRNQDFWKIGITNRTVMERYDYVEDREKITVLWEVPMPGHAAQELEQRILKAFAHHRYTGPEKPLRGVGTSEMLTADILPNGLVTKVAA